MKVVGVDGCRGGWVSATWHTDEATLTVQAHASFVALLNAHQDAVAIGVDIPIGLSVGESRLCDVAARKVLGPRRSSVFPAPDPRLLFETTYSQALVRVHELASKGISAQAFNICRKVAEVNWAMTWQSQDRVFEVHPEVSFWALAGRPMAHRKISPQGYAERRELLEKTLGLLLWPRAEAAALARPAAPDDVLDAVIVAWAAHRFAEGRAERMPTDPPIDARGLRMEIVY